MKYLHQSLKAILISAIIIVSAINGETQIGSQHSNGQFLIEATKISEPLTFCGEPVPLYEADIKERLDRELLVALDNSDDVIMWLKLANRYFPYIEKVLKNKSLPDDLKYIVIAESSLRPHAASGKGAVGFWQFIEPTGARYGMKINNDVDERRNFYTSTEAAISYLHDIHALFDSWTMAAAAYNMGEEGLKTETLVQKVNNYYQLYLNQETQRYVFRILAAKIIMSNPEKYGYSLDKEDLYQPIQFDRLEINTNQPVPLYIIAQAANTYFKVIKNLNPHLRNYYLSAGKHSLLIPQGAASGFSARYENLLTQWLTEKEESVYTVKKGDSLSTIANRFNVSIKAITIWNNITNGKKVSPGDKLFIFTNTNKLKQYDNATEKGTEENPVLQLP